MVDGDGGGLHLCCENLTVTISRSTISGNTAVEDPNVPGLNGEGGGIYHCCTDTSLTITDSTISDNDGPTQGGGIYTCCGVATQHAPHARAHDRERQPRARPRHVPGLRRRHRRPRAPSTLVNSTLSGNRARRDGGGIDNEDVLVMRNVTIAGNEGGRGGGFYEDGLMTTLGNVLFAGNVETPATPANCAAALGTDPLVSEGGNLSSDTTCPLAGTGDQASVDPAARSARRQRRPDADARPRADEPGGRRAAATPSVRRSTSAASRVRPTATATAPRAATSARSSAGRRSRTAMNGVDDNGNGLVDCLDFDCAGQPTCQERCDNCIDDDGDGNDRSRRRGDCAARATGAGAGVADPTRGKLVAKCAGAMQKAGAKVVGTRLKSAPDMRRAPR